MLVIDDEPDVRLLCRVNFELEGMEVVEAGDGPTGLAAARATRPDVIVLDVNMPGVDGWRVAEQLLRERETTAIPIVLLTERAEFGTTPFGVHGGRVSSVSKPFDAGKLATLVRRLGGGDDPAAGVREPRRPLPGDLTGRAALEPPD